MRNVFQGRPGHPRRLWRVEGDAAVFKVLGWTGGNFQINFEGKTSKQTTTLNTQGLLMEGLRMLDESKRDDGGAEEEEEDVLLDS